MADDCVQHAVGELIRDGALLINDGYPPDLQEEAVKTVLMQAELLCADWVAE
jgi:hypothetical protein